MVTLKLNYCASTKVKDIIFHTGVIVRFIISPLVFLLVVGLSDIKK